MNDVIANKIQTIGRCIKRIEEEYQGDPRNLENFTKQDAIILNIQRACEASIDLAMHLVSERNLGIPQNSRDAFDLLHRNKIIDQEMTTKMKAMVGFRNIAVHDYQAINLNIVRTIIEKHLEDFKRFADHVLKLQ
ncbi:type VII toxin-antitoxin system HepT family RNase toxin [Effusibacillus lacus]|uniref:DUF86 domain-containing protein n=1 Tax=Effusibacillus lacus TaxID=1348429 RepID=A0A292YN78_9BACL|nr:DUF86 domain-containing protein [Effusibacillus lacus]TCS72321.1 uncharacterized protein YutE (UPF0331/DUF86 family) [Effusibacillus lacus]GAX90213.1 hypothetical protein EFBL_1839 [Effusibacillus lacus]